MGGMMTIKIRLADGRAYQLDEVQAEGMSEQLDDESEFIEFALEDAEVRVYKRYIVSMEWKWVE